MPTRIEMLELVQAHKNLDDPMDTAIWIRADDCDRAWLVEVLPKMARDEHPERPVVFTAGGGFRYPLHLIGVNRDDIERALRIDPRLANDVANGAVLHGPAVGNEIIALAKDIVANGAAKAS